MPSVATGAVGESALRSRSWGTVMSPEVGRGASEAVAPFTMTSPGRVVALAGWSAT
jgi:hypothetical protein